MHINYERQLTPIESIKIANETIQTLNLVVDDRVYGRAQLKTYHCRLIDTKNKVIYFGCGKGLGLQSKASAYYEALEHYATHSFSQHASKIKTNYFPMQYSAADEKQQLSSTHEIPHVFLHKADSQEKILYPLFMIDPRYAKMCGSEDYFDYTPYAWRVSDSGIASGTNFTEASIHALNELIERDAYSIFLIKAFIKSKNQGLCLINKGTLPDRLKDIVMNIESQYKDDLAIFNITSNIGIPTIFVSMTKQNHLIQPKGCGTSLNSAYALERALLECLQPLHIFNEQAELNQKQIAKNFTNSPLLLKCAIANTDSILSKVELVDFNSLHSYNSHLTLNEQLELIKNKIKSHGFDIYYKIISELETGFTCVKYLVPGLEQFYLVQTGKFILPNKRGVEILKS